MPPTVVMEKQHWSFLSTYSMNEFRFAMNKGHGRKQRLAFRRAIVRVFSALCISLKVAVRWRREFLVAWVYPSQPWNVQLRASHLHADRTSCCSRD